jgi:hypothetical protein
VYKNVYLGEIQNFVTVIHWVNYENNLTDWDNKVWLWFK